MNKILLLKTLLLLLLGLMGTGQAMAQTSDSVAGSAARADGPSWLSYRGTSGPGLGKHIVLISAEQEYRSEQAMPMLAKILASHHSPRRG